MTFAHYSKHSLKFKYPKGLRFVRLSNTKRTSRSSCDYIETQDGNYSVIAITTDFVREWLTHMQQDHVQFRKITHRKTKSVDLKPATINTRLKTLKVLFNTLHTNLLIKTNPLANLTYSNPKNLSKFYRIRKSLVFLAWGLTVR